MSHFFCKFVRITKNILRNFTKIPIAFSDGTRYNKIVQSNLLTVLKIIERRLKYEKEAMDCRIIGIVHGVYDNGVSFITGNDGQSSWDDTDCSLRWKGRWQL